MIRENISVLLDFTRISNAIVYKDGLKWELYSFNKFKKYYKYCNHLDKCYNYALIEHNSNLSRKEIDNNDYLNNFGAQIKEVLLGFYKDDFNTLRRNLVIRDLKKNIIPFEDLSDESKELISCYIACQKDQLEKFYFKFKIVDEMKPVLDFKWLGFTTDLVELLNSLYEGSFFNTKELNCSKTMFIQTFCYMFGVEVKHPINIVDKSFIRSNPAQFLDKLKAIIMDCHSNLLVLKKGGSS